MDPPDEHEENTVADQGADSDSSSSMDSDSSSTVRESSARNGASSLSEKPTLAKRPSLGRQFTEEEIARVLSQRRTGSSSETDEDTVQTVKLVSRMFGHDRKANSDEEKTRHQGVVWKNLTVEGVGLGAAMQPTNSDVLFAIPRLIKQLITNGNRHPLRIILDNFTVCCFPPKNVP